MASIDHEKIRVQTAALRMSLEQALDIIEAAQSTLDEIEMAAGLVNDDGRRIDELAKD